jgi:hypothetical protein
MSDHDFKLVIMAISLITVLPLGLYLSLFKYPFQIKAFLDRVFKIESK